MMPPVSLPATPSRGLRHERFAFVAVLFVVWMAVTLVGELVMANLAGTDLHGLATSAPLYPVMAAAVLLLVVGLFRGWLGQIGLGLPHSWRLYGLPAAVTVVGLIVTLFAGVPAALGLVFLNAMAVGLSEELMFRGILDRWFRSAIGLVKGVVVVAVVFGAIHAFNAVITGEVAAAATQAAFNALAGLWYGVVRVRGGSIWPLVVIHGLWDTAVLASGLNGSTAGALLLSVGALVLVVYGIILTVGLARHQGEHGDPA